MLIGEEHSEEVLKALGRVSIAHEIAAGSTKHRFCDPTPAQRRDLGYKRSEDIEIEMSMKGEWDAPAEDRRRNARAVEIGRYFPIRERFWLDCLGAKTCQEEQVVFICGDLHIESGSFASLLEEKNVPYKVLERRLGVAEDESYYLALAYLRLHPEILNAPF